MIKFNKRFVIYDLNDDYLISKFQNHKKKKI
jgi:hypothetical protein